LILAEVIVASVDSNAQQDGHEVRPKGGGRGRGGGGLL